MSHIKEKILKWRSHQEPGSIMKPETFKEIEKEGDKEYGKGHGAAVAGAAYWKTVKAKYKGKHQKENTMNYVSEEFVSELSQLAKKGLKKSEEEVGQGVTSTEKGFLKRMASGEGVSAAEKAVLKGATKRI
jgi:hypothetical protein